jgi:hypothetical protein
MTGFSLGADLFSTMLILAPLQRIRKIWDSSPIFLIFPLRALRCGGLVPEKISHAPLRKPCHLVAPVKEKGKG